MLCCPNKAFTVERKKPRPLKSGVADIPNYSILYGNYRYGIRITRLQATVNVAYSDAICKTAVFPLIAYSKICHIFF